MKNKLLKSTAILLVIIMVSAICSVSFASSITPANIKTALEKCLNQTIFIKETDGRSTLNGEGSEKIIVTDTTIGGKLDGKEYNLFTYSEEGNYCTFDANIEDLYKLAGIDTSKTSKEDLAKYSSLLAFAVYTYMQEIYISIADCVGKDLSLAYTYLQQQFEKIASTQEKIDINLSNDVFSLIIKSDDKNVLETARLKINLDNLPNLDDSKIDKNKLTYKVFLGDLPNNEKEDISAEYKIDSIPNKAYTGKEVKPTITLLDKKYGFEAYLQEDDYTVSYSNNINLGKATVAVTGKGWYKGTVTNTFYIVPKKVQELKVKKQAKTSVTLNWTKNNEKVTGYKVYYYDYSKKAWKYSGKTTGTSYKVERLKTGTTYKFKVRAYKNIDGKQYFGSYSSTVRTSTKTKTPTLLKVTAGKKSATINLKKVLQADGYQIQYSTNKNFEKNNKATSTTKASKTISTLKSKKRYYFRVRAYRTVDGNRIYSSYSDIKSVKVK